MADSREGGCCSHPPSRYRLDTPVLRHQVGVEHDVAELVVLGLEGTTIVVGFGVVFVDEEQRVPSATVVGAGAIDSERLRLSFAEVVSQADAFVDVHFEQLTLRPASEEATASTTLLSRQGSGLTDGCRLLGLAAPALAGLEEDEITIGGLNQIAPDLVSHTFTSHRWHRITFERGG